MEVIVNNVKVPITVDTHRYIDPRTFDFTQVPVCVLCDDLRSFLGWAIKAHANDNYNHAFISHFPGMCVSQNFTGFAENKIEAYLKPGMMLKFWVINDLTKEEKTLIYTAIANRLKLPPWRHGYDFLGTFVGQLLRLKWIQNPFAEFCSEEVYDDWINPIKRIVLTDKGAGVSGVTKPSPSDLNTIFKAYPEYFTCIGYWWED